MSSAAIVLDATIFSTPVAGAKGADSGAISRPDSPDPAHAGPNVGENFAS
jgi:hypothetical protein